MALSIKVLLIFGWGLTVLATPAVLTTRSTGICDQRNKTTAWNEHKLGEYVTNRSVEILLSRRSPLQNFVDKSKRLSTVSYVCNFQQPCDQSLPLQYCSDNPSAMLTVSAVANFNNFFQNIAALIEKAKTSLDIATLAVAFAPPPEGKAAPKPDDTMKKVGFGFTAASAVLAFAAAIPGVAPFAALGLVGLSAATSVTSAALVTFKTATNSQGPAFESQFNIFANLSASLNALGSQVQYGLQQFVNEAINQPPTLIPFPGVDPLVNPLISSRLYAEMPNQIPFLLKNGTYASPLPDIPESVAAPNGILAAALSAPIINAHWQLARTVVVRASNKSLDGDFCAGDNSAPGYAKYCDNTQNMWAIVSLPTDVKHFGFSSTPGLDKLEQFGLDVQIVTQASYNHQLVNGINSNTTSPETVSAIAALDPRNIKLSDVVFFNLPVCFLDLVPQLSSRQSLSCAILGKKEEIMACRLYMQVTCGCPITQGWPYYGEEVTTFCGPAGPRPGVGRG